MIPLLETFGRSTQNHKTLQVPIYLPRKVAPNIFSFRAQHTTEFVRIECCEISTKEVITAKEIPLFFWFWTKDHDEYIKFN